MMKKFGALLLALAAIWFLGVAKLKPGQKPRVAYVTNGIASFWVIAEAGFREETSSARAISKRES